MKKFSVIILTLLFSLSAISQILTPVTWDTEVKEINNDTISLIINATIIENWHLYTQDIPEGGPIPTTFTFENENNDFELIGSTTESKSHNSYDKIFEMDLGYFDVSATFTQKIKLLNKELSEIKAFVDFQACDDEKCIFDSADLEFQLSGNELDSADSNGESASVKKDKSEENRGLWTIFFLAFLSGFAALLTPCVFPMIPLTVSFFTKQSENKAKGKKNAILYGLFIIIIYVLLGTLVTWIFGADALNALSTNVWFNIIFFLLLVIFAVSFLGAFEIVLPNSWANKVDKNADKGGIIGIFFMALALAIVSFSCTGPIVGTLLVEAASKGGLAPIIGMLGFSLAIALPFALFAFFPGWLNSLPKSGGWLNTVKVVLGF